MGPLYVALGIAALLFALHLLASFAERKGWIYYRTRPPRVRMLGFFEELVDPSVEHRVEQETSEAIRADRVDPGEGYGGSDESD